MTLRATTNLEVAARTAWDVVVIGAGPAGAMAALLLGRAGKRVMLVDRKSFPRPKTCGGCISSTGVQLLAQLSIADSLYRAGAQPLTSLRLHAGGSTATLALPGGVSLSRTCFDAIIVEQAIAAGIAFLPETVAHVTRDTDYEVRIHRAPASEFIPLQATAILVADGLGHPSLRARERFGESISKAARVGAACVLPFRLRGVSNNTVSMVVGQRGYVGLVQVENGQTNIAAALDPDFVRQQHGAANACASILNSAGFSAEEDLTNHAWLGAPQLTRRTLKHADQNVLLLGDASGYVEPFTGEGMTWAMLAAIEIQPFVERLLAGEAIAHEWTAHTKQTARMRQRWCKVIAYGLRMPWLPTACVHLLNALPNVAQPIVHWITERRIPDLAKAGA